MQKWALIVLVILATVTGCRRPGISSESKTASKSKITAILIKDPLGTNSGVAQVTGDLGDVGTGEVYVSVNGSEERRLFTVKKSHDWPWIRTGQTYEFRLYRGTNHSELLDSVKIDSSN